MLKNKKILITGAGGFIGSHLTEELLEHDNFVVLIDNFNDYYAGKEKQLNDIIKNYKLNENYELHKDDLLNSSLYNHIETDIEYVFHLAAQAGVRYSLEHPSEVSYNNIISTVNIFEFSRKLENLKKVVFASSSSVYGNPIYTPVDEQHPKNPISPYAVSKLSGELYGELYYREFHLPVTSLRFYTVYGPRGRPDMAIRKFFNLILQGSELIIYGDGTQRRDFTYISDIISGIILAGENQKANGEVFNLGKSNPISVNDLIDYMYEIAKKPKKVRYIEKQKGDVEVTHSNIEKAKNFLNYQPKVSVREGLSKQYIWQVNFNSN